MKREKLLRSREYWIVQIQNNLFGVMEEYMKNNTLNRTQLAEKLHVTKGYVSQVLRGDFDHKISKLVDLALFSGKAPIFSFVDLEKYIADDAENKLSEDNRHIRPIQNIVYIGLESGFVVNKETIQNISKVFNDFTPSDDVTIETNHGALVNEYILPKFHG